MTAKLVGSKARSEYHNSDYPQNEKGYKQFEKKYKK